MTVNSPRGNKRHGDTGIAHLLADYAAKNPSAPIEFMAVSDADELECGEWSVDVGCL